MGAYLQDGGHDIHLPLHMLARRACATSLAHCMCTVPDPQ